MIKILVLICSVFYWQNGMSKHKNIELKDGIYLTISDCLIPNLQSLMFNKVTFIKNTYIKDESLKIVKNNCKSNLLHQASIEYLTPHEVKEVLTNIRSDGLKVQEFSNDWLEVYILEGVQLDKYVTFHMVIKDKYHNDKFIHVIGWPQSSRKLESYSQICKFLTIFYKNNKAFDLYEKHLDNNICR